MPKSSVNRAKHIIKAIDKMKQKIGVEQAAKSIIERDLLQLRWAVTQVISQSSISNRQVLLDTFNQNRLKINELVNNLDHQIKQNKLEFFWKHTPEITPRLHLKHLSPLERMAFETKINTNDCINSCLQMCEELNAISKRTKNKALTTDTTQLLKIIQPFQAQLQGSKKAFDKAYDSPSNDTEIISLCQAQNKKLHDIMGEMEEKLNEFKPLSPQTSTVMRFILNLINYLKKDFVIIESPTQLARRKLHTMKHTVDQLHQEEKHTPKT